MSDPSSRGINTAETDDKTSSLDGQAMAEVSSADSSSGTPRNVNRNSATDKSGDWSVVETTRTLVWSDESVHVRIMLQRQTISAW